MEMANLIRWDPFRDLLNIRHDFERFFEGLFPRDERGVEASRESMFLVPRADVIDEGDAFVVRLDLPGVAKQDLKVEVKENILYITAQATEEKETKDADYLRRERRYGSFYRTFDFATPLVAEKVKAKLKNGILEVRAPKAQDKFKGIQVKVEE
jgi:HSP20 family protein